MSFSFLVFLFSFNLKLLRVEITQAKEIEGIISVFNTTSAIRRLVDELLLLKKKLVRSS